MAPGRVRNKPAENGIVKSKGTAVHDSVQASSSGAEAHHASGQMLALYRGRFLQWAPQAIVAACPSPDGTTVAIAREQGDVELWATDTCTRNKTLAGMDGAATTSVLLTGPPTAPRLFTAGLPGLLQERDLASGAVLASTDSYGGAVWGMVAQAHDDGVDVAVACDDGVVRLFSVEEGVPGLQYRRSMPRVEGRALCCAWHPTAPGMLVAGYADGCLRVWNVGQGLEVLRMTVARTTADAAELCVWAVLALPDGTLVSGDSAGHVTFWDGSHGTQLASFARHAADVLALAATPDGTRVVAAGVDPQLAMFHCIGGRPDSERGSWTYIDTKRPHTHDVRMLVLVQRSGAPPLLLSGGNDAQLIAYNANALLKEHPVRLDKVPDPPLLSVATSTAGNALVASAQRLHVDVWQWAMQDNKAATNALQQQPPPPEGTLLPCAAAPMHCLRLKKLGGHHITALALSPDGKYMAYSDIHKLRVFALPEDNDVGAPSRPLTAAPTRLQLDPCAEALHTLCTLCFGGGQLLAADVHGTVTLLALPSCNIVCQWHEPKIAAVRLPGASTGFDPTAAAAAALGSTALAGGVHPCGPHPVSAMHASADGRMAVAGGKHLAFVFDLQRRRCLGHVPPLPEGSLSLTALSLSADGQLAAVASADSRVALYRLPSMQVHPWTHALEQLGEAALQHIVGHVSGIRISPQGNGAFLWSHSSICFLEFDHPPRPAQPHLTRKRPRSTPPKEGPVRVLHCVHPVLFCGQVGPNAALLLESPWEDVLRALPTPPMLRKRFGV